MNEKFYIIRVDYHGEKRLLAMLPTLLESLRFVHEHELCSEDAAIEFCRGAFPSDYEVYKTMFARGRCFA